MGREEGSGWGTHVYLWQIHFDIWQNQYNIVKLKKKVLAELLVIKILKYILISTMEAHLHNTQLQLVAKLFHLLLVPLELF